MKISVLKETSKGENRVAATPDSIKRLLSKFKNIEFLVEKSAGEKSGFLDADYKAVGAKISTPSKAYEADVVLKVNAPSSAEAKKIKAKSLLLGFLNPAENSKLFKEFAKQKINAISVEKIPRISRAQSMDGLSSQANIGGYRAVLEAGQHLNRFFPIMMTAAGTSKPAKTIILGVGVAGLQAIATAKRLGASVEAFDVRPEVKEQVESLGAKFIEIDLGEDGSGEGGYAKELSAEAKKKQQDALQEILKKADVVITTALIPGRPAPVLLTEDTVKGMKKGSVIVDMAAANGGNCPLTEKDKVIEKHGVILVGHTNYPSFMAQDSSNFYARNLLNLLTLLIEEKDGKASINYNMEDEIIAGSLVAFEGEVK